MEPQILVVSDPPHRGVEHDAVAAILGLDVADARLKIDFPAPEVLSASDMRRAKELAESLERAGLSVAIIEGDDLAPIPWPSPASSLDFGAAGLVARLDGVEIELPYDTPVVGIYCRPPADAAAPPRSEGEQAAPTGAGDGFAIAEAIEWMSILDLYFTREGTLKRVSVVQGITDCSGLERAREAVADDDVAAAVAECRRRFPRLTLDDRLEGVRPRHRLVMGESPFDLDMRKLFSFGTLLLRQVLDSISPELRDITQYELGSRLGYVLSRRNG